MRLFRRASMGWPRIAAILFVSGALVPGTLAAQTLRSQAVVDLSFDEASGEALDTAAAGAAKDNATLANGAARIKSPFWGQKGKQAVVLDAAARQFVQVPHSADVSRPDALTFALFFINLHPRTEAGFRGLLAKRNDAGMTANYGINYAPNTDILQFYVNDTRGFRAAHYSVEGVVGHRRPGFVSATLEVGDAPAPDADEDKDDVLIRLYANGKPLAPKTAAGGTVAGNDVWLTDVKIEGIVNEVPLTLGCSSAGLEHTSCVIDEFLLFPRAFSPEEIEKLFTEVAGANVAEQIADEARPVPTAPEITGLSTGGLTRGQTTVVAVQGTNLLPDPRLVSPAPFEKATLRPGATAERLDFEISVPATAPAGHYPVRVQTPRGISGALALAIDSLPQLSYSELDPEKPVSLPAAISGTFTGQQQVRVFFSAKGGQRVIVDVECKRLGAACDPVLELRNPRGAPLAIAWGRAQYQGDARLASTLFADGIYSVELHDLAYKAPGENRFRLKIGDLKIVDATFPAAVAAAGAQSVFAVGPGIDPALKLPVEVRDFLPGITLPVPLPPESGAVGASPGILTSQAVELIEEPQLEGTFRTIDARFAERPHIPIVLNGRIGLPGESDTYLLDVKPGAPLVLAAESQALRTPLEPQLRVLSHPEGALLAASEDRPTVEYAVPADVSKVQVAVRDLNRRGGPEFLYRLRISPGGQPDFTLSASAERAAVSADGGTVLRVDVNRAGYSGPVALSLHGAPWVQFVPSQIPAGDSKAFLTLASTASVESAGGLLSTARLVGESVGLDPPLRRTALAPVDNRLAVVPGYRGELTLVQAEPVRASLVLGSVPGTLFKASDAAIPLTLAAQNPALAEATVRLTLLTTETPRTRVDPTDPTQQRRIPIPAVRSIPEQTLRPGEQAGSLRIAVPIEVEEPNIDCVVRCDFVPHAFSDKALATIYSAPFRLSVQKALDVELAAKMLPLTAGAQAKFSGKVKRTAGFDAPVDVAIVNLPAGYEAPKVTVPPGQVEFEVVVTAPAAATAADLPNVLFRVTGSGGTALQPDVPVAAKVSPP